MPEETEIKGVDLVEFTVTCTISRELLLDDDRMAVASFASKDAMRVMRQSVLDWEDDS